MNLSRILFSAPSSRSCCLLRGLSDLSRAQRRSGKCAQAAPLSGLPARAPCHRPSGRWSSTPPACSRRRPARCCSTFPSPSTPPSLPHPTPRRPRRHAVSPTTGPGQLRCPINATSQARFVRARRIIGHPCRETIDITAIPYARRIPRGWAGAGLTVGPGRSVVRVDFFAPEHCGRHATMAPMKTCEITPSPGLASPSPRPSWPAIRRSRRRR